MCAVSTPYIMKFREKSDKTTQQAEVVKSSGEKISASAVQYSGELFTGTLHSDVYNAIREKYPQFDPELEWEKYKLGFVTTSGRFVNRDEALKIAERNDQLKPGVSLDYLDAVDLKKKD